MKRNPRNTEFREERKRLVFWDDIIGGRPGAGPIVLAMRLAAVRDAG